MFCGLRHQVSKDQEVYEEITLLDLKIRYGGTPEGRRYIADIETSQKGKRHPDPKAAF